ncbi:hypothetical protein JCM30237_22970 [Halolamina litorea]|uniref:Transcriptional regulator n=1 Tax=Halolamina litorea TaxID=1515593 RepID=A0ABD6BRA3_9EURY|nr:hypothetical protein [Halolamina litorea]
MTALHVPKGVSRETLLDVVRGWYEAGADTDAVGTSTVADRLDLADSVSRQTRFLESLGVLQTEDQQHRLTDPGIELGRALAEGDTAAAVERLGTLLADWPLSDTLHDALAGRSLSAAAVVAELADTIDEDPEGRVRTGLTTLLECYVWTGLIERENGRYALPENDAGRSDDGTETLNVGLELTVDLNPEDVEGLVTALRKGLAADLEEPNPPALAADLRVDDDGGIHLDAEREGEQ